MNEPPDEVARDDAKKTHVSLPFEPPNCEHDVRHGHCPDCFTEMESKWIVEVSLATAGSTKQLTLLEVG